MHRVVPAFLGHGMVAGPQLRFARLIGVVAAWSRPFKSEQSSVAELVHGSMTTPSMLSESSAICMAEARSRSAMGRLAVPLSASAIFTEVNTGR